MPFPQLGKVVHELAMCISNDPYNGKDNLWMFYQLKLLNILET